LTRSATSSACISIGPSAPSGLCVNEEVPDPGALSHRADPADAARHPRARDPRLPSRGHVAPVRGAGPHDRPGDARGRRLGMGLRPRQPDRKAMGADEASARPPAFP
jgi:hypothetical protein